jgi:broad specificity phosphatase PhoE
MTFIFVRHAQAQPSGPRVNEVLGMPLTELGHQQALRVAVRLSKEKLDHIYTSNLSRAYETAQEILKYHKTTPCTVLSDIREVTHYHFIPGSRPMDLMIRKCVREEKRAMTRFIAQMMKNHKGGDRILVVAHGNIIRTLIPMLGGRDPKKAVLLEIHNAATNILDIWSNGQAVLKLANCTRHLTPKQITT